MQYLRLTFTLPNTLLAVRVESAVKGVQSWLAERTLRCFLLAFLPALALLARPAGAAISLQDGSTAITYAASTAISQPFTVTAGASVLMVMETDKGTSAVAPASLAYGSQTLTQAVTTSTATTYRNVSIFYLFNPAPGTTNITGMASNASVWLSAYTLSGVHTGVTPLTGSVVSGGATGVTNSVAGVAASSWAAMNGIYAESSGTFTVTGTGGTPVIAANTNDTSVADMGYVAGISVGTDTFTYNLASGGGGSQKMALVTAVFTPASAGILSPANSMITANPSSIPANGTSTSTITVQARDTLGNNMTTGGAAINLNASAGALGGVTDNANGTYTAMLTSASSPGTATITGTMNGSAIGYSTNVIFVGLASAANTVITANPGSLVANGSSTATVTVQAKDSFGKNLLTSGGTVVLNTTSGTLGAVTDNNNGTYTAILTSPNIPASSTNNPGSAAITGTISGAAIGTPASVTIIRQLYFQDGFAYASGTELGSNAPWANPENGITINNSGLNYAQGNTALAAVVPAGLAVSDVSEGSDYGVTYAPLTTNATTGAGGYVYCSFLISVSAAPNQGYNWPYLGLMAANQTTDNPGSATEAFTLYCENGNASLGLRVANGATPSTFTNISLGTTCLVVIKYNLATGNGYLFLNPTLGGGEPATPTLTAPNPSKSPNFTGSTALGRFYLDNSYTGFSPGFVLANLRIGSIWADVTPTTASPGTLFVAEGFGTNYAVGTLTNQVNAQAGYVIGSLFNQNPAQAGFDGPWIGFGTANVQTVGLRYPNLGQADSNSVVLYGTSKVGRAFLAGNNGPLGNYEDNDNNFSLSRDGTVLNVAFLMQLSNVTASASLGFYGDGTNLNQPQLGIMADGAKTGDFWLTGSNGVGLANLGALNTSVNLFVLGINFQSGSNVVSVYVNPVAGTTTPSATVTITNVNLAFNGLGLTCSNAAAGAIFDEIRFGNAFASVTSSNLLATLPGPVQLQGINNTWYLSGNIYYPWSVGFPPSPIDGNFPYVNHQQYATNGGPSYPYGFFPWVDQFGQYRWTNWTDKIISLQDLTNRAGTEQADLAANPPPSSWDAWGGWSQGPQLPASASFYTTNYHGKWWLVDPAGNLFYTHGLDSISIVNTIGTIGDSVTGREDYFASLPLPGSATAQFYNGAAMNFFGANCFLKYGANWENYWLTNLMPRRMLSWGMNTMGAYCDTNVDSLDIAPYVVYLSSPGTDLSETDENGRVYSLDFFDPAFVSGLSNTLAGQPGHKDPWCIGFTVDGENNWFVNGRVYVVTNFLAAPATCHGKIAFQSELEQTYATNITSLNTSWGTTYTSGATFCRRPRCPRI